MSTDNVKSFIEDKIGGKDKEIIELEELIAKKAGPLLEKKKLAQMERDVLRKTLREFDKANKPAKAK